MSTRGLDLATAVHHVKHTPRRPSGLRSRGAEGDADGGESGLKVEEDECGLVAEHRRGSSSAYSIDDFYNPTTVIPVPLLSFDRYRVNPGTGKYTFSQWSGFLWPSPFTISLAWQRSF